MRHEEKKISKMSDEIMTFFLEHGANDITMQVRYLETESILKIKAKPIINVEPIVNMLQESLSTPRQNEMEEYYWELAGESDASNELCIVGGMADVASIDYDEIMHEIEIELIRYKHK